jgi:hypothetical protein
MAIVAKNEIRMKIEKDGTVTISTDAFDDEIHDSADQLVNETIETLAGEHVIVERKDKDQHTHTHHHGHVHSGH